MNFDVEKDSGKGIYDNLHHGQTSDLPSNQSLLRTLSMTCNVKHLLIGHVINFHVINFHAKDNWSHEYSTVP